MWQKAPGRMSKVQGWDLELEAASSQIETLNPKPKTLNPKPYIWPRRTRSRRSDRTRRRRHPGGMGSAGKRTNFHTWSGREGGVLPRRPLGIPMRIRSLIIFLECEIRKCNKEPYCRELSNEIPGLAAKYATTSFFFLLLLLSCLLFCFF